MVHNITDDVIDDIVNNTVGHWQLMPMDGFYPFVFRPAPPAVTDVAAWIRTRIHSARFVPGQRLVEVDIMRQTGAGRSKVREALQRLCTEGLVEIEEFKGARVREVSEKDARQLNRARAVLEELCAADFAVKASAQEKAKLRDLTVQMEECVASISREELANLEAQWHSQIMRLTDNNVIEGLIKRHITPVLRLQFITFHHGDSLQREIANRRLVLDAILEGNGPGAEAARRRLVENG